jgi:hypothetical protein
MWGNYSKCREIIGNDNFYTIWVIGWVNLTKKKEINKHTDHSKNMKYKIIASVSSSFRENN